MKFIRSLKCAHCSFPFLDGELVLYEQGDLYHKPCLRIMRSNVLIGRSAELRRRSREVVEAARRVFLAHRQNHSTLTKSDARSDRSRFSWG